MGNDIILKDINKYYSSNHVLKDINLTIHEGEFMTLLGPSGCGKTTTLRVVAGLEKPQTGTITIGEKLIVNASENFFLNPGQRDMNLVFQSYALWPHMTVFDNVAFGLRAQHRTEGLERKVRDALHAVQLDDYADRFPSELSGGQQQRVSFARAIVTEPECILFDEPLSALDALLREEMRTEIKALVSSRGITSVFVTHDQTEAMSMSDMVAVMSEGRIDRYGTPEELYANPMTAFSARFIGSSNWLDERTMFRPEDASIGRAGYKASVIGSEYMGSHYRLILDHHGRRWVVNADERHDIGEKLIISVAPGSIITIKEA